MLVYSYNPTKIVLENKAISTNLQQNDNFVGSGYIMNMIFNEQLIIKHLK